MNMSTKVTAACTRKTGSIEGLAVEGGKQFKIETSPQGEDIVDIAVPAGKIWSVDIEIVIEERDA